MSARVRRAFLFAAALSLGLFFPPALVLGEPAGRPGDDRENVLEGTLTGYGTHHVEVEGRRILLCKDATILDPEDNPIALSGLCATHSVRVTLDGYCAAEVQVLVLRR